MNLTNEDVQEILRLLDASAFDELSLETERFKLILRRSGRGERVWTQQQKTLGSPSIAAVQAKGSAAVLPEKAPSAPDATLPVSAEGVVEIRPTIMGTFYRAPKPGAPPFVEIGSTVTPDTVVGIIETMKLMNSIYAGAHGTVVDICAANGELVEPDRVLIRLQRRHP